MKKIFFYITLIAGIASCSKDTLDKVNPNVLTSDTYWKNETDVLQAMAATYYLLPAYNSGYWSTRGVEVTNARGDDFFIRNDVTDLYKISTFINTADNAIVTNIFNNQYQGIFKANQVLANIDRAALTDDKKKVYLAEAKFLRGLFFFNLVINFGDVPLRISIPSSSSDYNLAKSPEADVWAQIYKDFTEAAADLPVAWSGEWLGRATKGAALGYLGKAYLYSKDYANAATTLHQLTASPFAYALRKNYEDNFTDAFENNEESLFEVQIQDAGGPYFWAGNSSQLALGTFTAQEFAPSEVAGWFEAAPTDKLLHEFEKEKTQSGDYDPRMYATLVWDYPGATYYNKPFKSFALWSGFHSMFRKYQNWKKDNELTGSNGSSFVTSINERVLRYADVLLMLAEALTMDGKVGEAYPYLNQVRNRANLAPFPAGTDKDKMMAEIRHQRMIEFAREGTRFYDLKRWGLLQQELTNSDKVGREFFIPKKYDYFPVPQAEINTNHLAEQNPNW
ncbi:RagB/SusD family nutrient uptake outer membrane protein [Deminuibacter soli]|uniref:RagB/SusD family nutrient uptake outer membrane protein n=1 Tax=Deminuibacter soli TaxID=2291815 RepID=A0A3E1NEH1_9BACT|nr:RagB/SusD family nutrient uptake outer membrane protein [Deminuibacter soli]RFM26168.1 RagB/SusD family nutrient uptake outer membrane protein [Deminuibacter soli]